MRGPTGLVTVKDKHFFHKCTKLEMLATEAYVGKRKINSAEKLPLVGLNLGPIVLYYVAFLT